MAERTVPPTWETTELAPLRLGSLGCMSVRVCVLCRAEATPARGLLVNGLLLEVCPLVFALESFGAVLGRLQLLEESVQNTGERPCDPTLLENLAMRVQMFEEVYVSLDWEQVGKFVDTSQNIGVHPSNSWDTMCPKH